MSLLSYDFFQSINCSIAISIGQLIIHPFYPSYSINPMQTQESVSVLIFSVWYVLNILSTSCRKYTFVQSFWSVSKFSDILANKSAACSPSPAPSFLLRAQIQTFFTTIWSINGPDESRVRQIYATEVRRRSERAGKCPRRRRRQSHRHRSEQERSTPRPKCSKPWYVFCDY